MSKSSSPVKNITFNEDWTDHPLIGWLNAKKQYFLWGFVACLALLLLIYRQAAVSSLNAEKDYFLAQTAFTQFQQESITSNDSNKSADDFKKLYSIIQQHPELQAKYDGTLAQTLLIIGQIPEAELLSHQIFSRTQSDHLQLYQDYTQASLLIGQGKFEEALAQTLQLQSSFDRLNNTKPLLYIFTLIRLGFLYQQTGQESQELLIWKEFQNLPQYEESIRAATQTFTLGQATLGQYINERINTLDN